MDATTPQNIFAIWEQLRIFVPIIGVCWAVFKGYTWVQSNLTATQTGVTELKTAVEAQTTAIVHATEANTTQVKELRDDVKQMVTAMMVPARARAARRKK